MSCSLKPASVLQVLKEWCLKGIIKYENMNYLGLARWLSWLEHQPVHKVVGSIPSWGAYGRQAIGFSFTSLFPFYLSPPTSLKINF